MRDVPFFLQDFVDRYEGRYQDVQLPLPMRLVGAVAFQRKKPAAIGVKAPFPGFIEPELATSIGEGAICNDGSKIRFVIQKWKSAVRGCKFTDV